MLTRNMCIYVLQYVVILNEFAVISIMFGAKYGLPYWRTDVYLRRQVEKS